MDPERWAHVKDLVARAIELPPEERRRFLGEAIGADEALRERVQELLDHEEGARSFLADPVASDPLRYLPELAGLSAGTRLAGYRIVGILGRGGSSTVYEAVQDSPRRKVALKVLAASGEHADTRARFEAESAMLARLNHPGIAKVYESSAAAAAEDSLAYIAMEWVEGGRSLLDHASGEALPRSERLELFARICDAVEHGHLRGVVHRDLKPANVLVDEHGHPKVIDFGIARLLEEGADPRGSTRGGSILGTVAYMSPEQCEGDPLRIDTRTDVYSLGVLLYELICGRLPYEVDGKSFTAALRVVREHAPVRPGRWIRGLESDLEAILLRALEKDADRRYATAGDLARDLRRFMRHEPVEASSPTALHEARLFVRRNLLGTTIAGAVLVVLLITTALFLLHSFEVAKVERTERARARQAATFLSSILSLANPTVSDPASLTLRDVLDQASARVEPELADAPFARAEVHGTISGAYHELGLFDEAEVHMRAVANIYREHCPDEITKVACAIHMHGHALVSAGRAEEAEVLLREALALHDQSRGAPPFLRAIATNHLSRALFHLGRLEEAEEQARSALFVYQQSFGPRHPSVARALQNLGTILLERGEFEEAESMASTMLELDLENHGPDSLQAARAHLHRAVTLARYMKPELARGEATRAQDLLAKFLPADHPDRQRARELAEAP